MNVYRFLADAVLLLHFVYVAFVVLGMAAILAGIALRWPWVRNFWFRIIHFLMIAVVAAESLCGVLCPLTEWEDTLRELAGEVERTGDRSLAAGRTSCCLLTRRRRCCRSATAFSAWPCCWR